MSRMIRRAVVDDSNLYQPRSPRLISFDHGTLDPIQEFQLPEVLGRSLESRPVEEIIPAVVSSDESKPFLELSHFAAHQGEFGLLELLIRWHHDYDSRFLSW